MVNFDRVMTALEKLASIPEATVVLHEAVISHGLIDSYSSLSICKLLCASIIQQTHTFHEAILKFVTQRLNFQSPTEDVPFTFCAFLGTS